MAPFRIAFSDWAHGTQPAVERIMRLLSARRDVLRTTPAEADLLIYSDFGEHHWEFQGLKVYFTGKTCSLTSINATCHSPLTNQRMTAERSGCPFSPRSWTTAPPLLRPSGYDGSRHLGRSDFFSFVVSNPICRIRNRIFKTIHRRRPVASGGRHFNNTEGAVPDKLAFLRRHRFNIAVENSRSTGCITEKLIDPLLAGSIAIYWGAPDVLRDFDPHCMINVADFDNLDALVAEVMRIDGDFKAQRRMLNAPVFAGNKEPACMTDAYVADPLTDLIENRQPAPRRVRKRRLREHIKAEQGAFAYKRDKLLCKMESLLWKFGWQR